MKELILPKYVIDNYIKGNSYSLLNIYFPLEYLSWRKPKILGSQDWRKQRLESRSPNEVNFRDKIYELKAISPSSIELDFEEEVQIFIEDRVLWNEILDHFKISQESPDRTKNFFQVDFYFYNSGVIFEVDSDYHNDSVLEDKARDKYLELKYGLVVYRCFYYSPKIHNLQDFLELLKTRLGNKVDLNFRFTFERLLRHKEKDILGNLLRIENYTNGDIIYSRKNIAFTMKDLYLSEWVEENRDYRITNDMTRVSKFFEDYFSRIFYIHPGSSEYTCQEVIDLLECNDPWEKWKNKIIPGWVIGILGKPPRGFKYDTSKGYGKSKEFVKKLQELKII